MNRETDYDKILYQVKEINKKYKQFKNSTGKTQREFETEMKNEYSDLYDSFNFIFNRAVSGNLDTTVFSYMIQKAKAVKSNQMTNYDASKDVGQKLVDTFVKPKLDKKK